MKFQVSNDKIDSIRNLTNKIKAVPRRLGENAKIEKRRFMLAYIVGYAASFLIYITLFIYGAMSCGV